MLSGYLTREGEFIDVSGYKITPDESAHNIFCDAYGYVEEELMEVRGWVKLTTCLPHKYIYMMILIKLVDGMTMYPKMNIIILQYLPQ